MIWIRGAAGSVLMLAFLVAGAAAATPTRVSAMAPAAVGMGEDITIDARLMTGDGDPIAGAALTLVQVGAVGDRMMAEGVTDTDGKASFLHNEFTLPHLSLAVVFRGDGIRAPSRAEVDVAISGLEEPPSVVMSHTPDPMIKLILFFILGTVWATYAFAATCILRIRRERPLAEVRRAGWSR